MSDWNDGPPRTFSNNLATVTVQAHIHCKTWERHGPDDLVDTLVLMDKKGDEEAAQELFTQVQALFVGQPCRKWYEYPTKI